MNLSIYQIILSFVAVVFMFSNISNFILKKNNFTFFKFFAAMTIWGGVLVFSIFPELAHSITEFIGAGENLNTIIFSGFIVCFVAIFKIINIIERLERNISEIVRKEALKKLEK